MSKVWKDTDCTNMSNEPYRQTLAIQRLGYGHVRQN
jgi:hypothetical protein